MTRDDVAKLELLTDDQIDGFRFVLKMQHPDNVRLAEQVCAQAKLANRPAISSALPLAEIVEEFAKIRCARCAKGEAVTFHAGYWRHMQETKRNSRGIEICEGWIECNANDIRAHAQSLQAKINAAEQANRAGTLKELSNEDACSAAPNAATPHPESTQCGFDRNGSHSAGHYVCMCGWEDVHIYPAAAPSDRKQEAGLIERLAIFADRLKRNGFSPGIEGDEPLIREAASALAARDEEIAGLRERNESLTSAIEFYKSDNLARRQVIADTLKRIEVTESEAAELRAKVEALEADQEPATMGQALGAARDKD